MRFETMERGEFKRWSLSSFVCYANIKLCWFVCCCCLILILSHFQTMAPSSCRLTNSLILFTFHQCQANDVLRVTVKRSEIESSSFEFFTCRWENVSASSHCLEGLKEKLRPALLQTIIVLYRPNIFSSWPTWPWFLQLRISYRKSLVQVIQQQLVKQKFWKFCYS